MILKWLTMYSLAYLFKQTLAIPGSGLMNVLMGVLVVWVYGSSAADPENQQQQYHQILAWIVVCLLASTGSVGSYWLSYLGLRKYSDFFLSKIKLDLSSNKSNLLYLISIRAFPFTPNWLLNLALPHLGVGVGEFWLSSLIGQCGYNLVGVRAGFGLGELMLVGSVFNNAAGTGTDNSLNARNPSTQEKAKFVFDLLSSPEAAQARSKLFELLAFSFVMGFIAKFVDWLKLRSFGVSNAAESRPSERKQKSS